ncbi:glycerophosphodiester phosphodiesterase [Tumebacillus permanentifrigoris]|uniref:Glycerophosphoryl diester phosphodiesterase n=1 Tax=Tumebacillus permanentifrigoris TaxID=378543 RepID=A0A316D7A7_9BACL|nr:glycerophosphodiester phosphodiesterase [Tumebacillus permanentifrigoris]PWK11346.1 glycerophosphoryl diester phosphodiesterase [Tumebacillus permanentifrigoris]
MQINRKKVLNLAHRGASGYAPENTMEAFQVADLMGADGFEFDVQITRDGVPVVIHDELLNRTTNGRGYVHEHTLAELRALDAGSWYDPSFAGERIPTLQEVIDAFGNRMVLNIELKNSIFPMPGLEERTLELIRRYQIEERVIVSSFHHGSMQKFHQLAPDISTGLLYDCVIVGAVEYAKRLGARALHPFFATIKPQFLAEAHAAELAVNVWTVNEEEHMRLVANLGVDAIITNYPDRLKGILESTYI